MKVTQGGQSDSPLTQHGIEQARSLGYQLSHREEYDIIVTSSQGRAIKTCNIILEDLEVKNSIQMDSLKEQYLGHIENKTSRSSPLNRTKVNKPAWFNGRVRGVMETEQQLTVRQKKFMFEILEIIKKDDATLARSREQKIRILAVTHGTYIKHFLKHQASYTAKIPKYKTCAFTRIHAELYPSTSIETFKYKCFVCPRNPEVNIILPITIITLNKMESSTNKKEQLTEKEKRIVTQVKENSIEELTETTSSSTSNNTTHNTTVSIPLQIYHNMKITADFVSHGETGADLYNIIQGGFTDSPLTETGKRQIHRLGERIIHRVKPSVDTCHYDFLFTSTQKRAEDSLKLLQAHMGIYHSYIALDSLRDRYIGDLENTPNSAHSIKDQPPEEYYVWLQKPKYKNEESDIEFMSRQEAFIKEMAQIIRDDERYLKCLEKNRSVRVLIMTHGAYIKHFLKKFVTCPSIPSIPIYHQCAFSRIYMFLKLASDGSICENNCVTSTLYPELNIVAPLYMDEQEEIYRDPSDRSLYRSLIQTPNIISRANCHVQLAKTADRNPITHIDPSITIDSDSIKFRKEKYSSRQKTIKLPKAVNEITTAPNKALSPMERIIIEAEFMRHAETEAEVNNILQGKFTDSPVTRKGYEDIRRAIRRQFKENGNKKEYDLLITSSQGRAVETCKILHSHYHNVPHHISTNLNERSMGVLENTFLNSAIPRFKKEQEDRLIPHSPWSVRPKMKRRRNKESKENMDNRSTKFIKEIQAIIENDILLRSKIIREKRNVRIIVVTHPLFLKHFVTSFVNTKGLKPTKYDSCSVSKIHMEITTQPFSFKCQADPVNLNVTVPIDEVISDSEPDYEALYADNYCDIASLPTSNTAVEVNKMEKEITEHIEEEIIKEDSSDSSDISFSELQFDQIYSCDYTFGDMREEIAVLSDQDQEQERGVEQIESDIDSNQAYDTDSINSSLTRPTRTLVSKIKNINRHSKCNPRIARTRRLMSIRNILGNGSSKAVNKEEESKEIEKLARDIQNTKRTKVRNKIKEEDENSLLHAVQDLFINKYPKKKIIAEDLISVFSREPRVEYRETISTEILNENQSSSEQTDHLIVAQINYIQEEEYYRDHTSSNESMQEMDQWRIKYPEPNPAINRETMFLPVTFSAVKRLTESIPSLNETYDTETITEDGEIIEKEIMCDGGAQITAIDLAQVKKMGGKLIPHKKYKVMVRMADKALVESLYYTVLNITFLGKDSQQLIFTKTITVLAHVLPEVSGTLIIGSDIMRKIGMSVTYDGQNQVELFGQEERPMIVEYVNSSTMKNNIDISKDIGRFRIRKKNGTEKISTIHDMFNRIHYDAELKTTLKVPDEILIPTLAEYKQAMETPRQYLLGIQLMSKQGIHLNQAQTIVFCMLCEMYDIEFITRQMGRSKDGTVKWMDVKSKRSETFMSMMFEEEEKYNESLSSSTIQSVLTSDTAFPAVQVIAKQHVLDGSDQKQLRSSLLKTGMISIGDLRYTNRSMKQVIIDKCEELVYEAEKITRQQSKIQLPIPQDRKEKKHPIKYGPYMGSNNIQHRRLHNIMENQHIPGDLVLCPDCYTDIKAKIYNEDNCVHCCKLEVLHENYSFNTTRQVVNPCEQLSKHEKAIVEYLCQQKMEWEQEHGNSQEEDLKIRDEIIEQIMQPLLKHNELTEVKLQFNMNLTQEIVTAQLYDVIILKYLGIIRPNNPTFIQQLEYIYELAIIKDSYSNYMHSEILSIIEKEIREYMATSLNDISISPAPRYKESSDPKLYEIEEETDNSTLTTIMMQIDLQKEVDNQLWKKDGVTRQIHRIRHCKNREGTTEEAEYQAIHTAIIKDQLRKDLNLSKKELEVLCHNIDITTEEKDEVETTCTLAEIEATKEEAKAIQYIRDLTKRRCTTEMAQMRPTDFPEKYWKYVFDTEKPLVKERWDTFNNTASKERLQEVIQQIKSIDISKETTSRKLEEKYFRAQCFANINRYAHPDIMNLPKNHRYEYEINLDDTTPCMARMRRTSTLENAYLYWRTQQLTNRGIIQLSKSAYNNPPLCVPYAARIAEFMELHGDSAMDKIWLPEYRDEVLKFYRLVNDFRNLNEKTKLERWPLPYIIDLLDRMKGSSRYTTQDIEDAFYTVPMKPEHRPFTAFSTPFGHFEYICMGQGLKNAANFFARMVHEMFNVMKIQGKAIAFYQDDICNHENDLEKHLDLQQRIYDTMAENSLVFKPSKAHINYLTQRILGHIMSQKGRSIDPKLTESITKLAVPTTLEGVRSVLGLAQVAREYVHGLSKVLEPIQKLAKKNVRIMENWGPEQDKAFEHIKTAITTAPILAIPDIHKKFRIHVDACRIGRGIGAILLQQDEDILAKEEREHWRPVAYWSRALSKEERRYSATELECTALHDSIMHWRIYLQCGRSFEAIVDHYALVYMVTKMGAAEANRRLTKLCIELQDYTFTVTHRSGTQHLDADAVSRLLRCDDPAMVYTEDELRNDIGPLTEEEKAMLEGKFGIATTNTIIDIIDMHREEVNSLAEREAEIQDTKIILETASIESTPKQSDEYKIEEWNDDQTVLLNTIRVTSYEQLQEAKINNSRLCGIMDQPEIAEIFTTLQSITNERPIRSTRNVPATRLMDTEHSIRLTERQRRTQKRLQDQVMEEQQRNLELERKQKEELEKENQIYQQENTKLHKKLKRKQDKIDTHLHKEAINKIKNSVQQYANEHQLNIAPETNGIIKEKEVIIPIINKEGEYEQYPIDIEKNAEIQKAVEVMKQISERAIKRKHKLITISKNTMKSTSRIVDEEYTEQRMEELLLEELHDFDYLVQEHYIDPNDKSLCVIINTYYDRTIGKLMATTIPLDSENPKNVDPDKFRTIEIQGEKGVRILVEEFHKAYIYNTQPWPRNSIEWLQAQEQDDVWKQVINKIQISDTCISLAKATGEIDYITREYLSDGKKLGPLIRITVKDEKVKHESIVISYKKEFKQMVVPQMYVNSVLQLYHEGMGHIGVSRMTESLKQNYFWNSMNADIAQYCSDCHYCSSRKASTTRGKIPVQGYFMTHRPWQRVHADCATGFPITSNGYTAVLILKDALTKWVEIVPIKSVSAISIAEAMISVFTDHGVPEYLITDNGTEFSNVLLEDVMELLAAKHMHTTPVNPQANGLAENAVKTFKNMLASMISKDQRDWDKFVKLVKMQYNTTVNSATGFTPFFFMMGREMSQPTEEHIREMHSNQQKEIKIESYLDKLTTMLMLLWEKAGEEIQTTTEHYNKVLGLDIPDIMIKEFAVGEYIYIRRLPRRFWKDINENVKYHINAKLQACRWAGAYRVLEKISPVLYVVDIHNKEKIIHVRHMKSAGKLSNNRRKTEHTRLYNRQQFLNKFHKANVVKMDTFIDIIDEGIPEDEIA